MVYVVLLNGNLKGVAAIGVVVVVAVVATSFASLIIAECCRIFL